MQSKIIIMLTHNDQTVKNALEVFEENKDLSIQFWGFKNVGLPIDEMKKLINAMKAARKTTFLEVVTYSEEECLAGAKLAVELGFDYLMGTLYYESVWAYLKDKSIKYLPFVGKVSGSPSILDGSIQEMIDQANWFETLGIKGIDILAYRYVNDPEELAEKFVSGVKLDTVMAGSIDSVERINTVNRINPWAFTMGSALFTKKFLKDGTLKQNLKKVIEVMDSIK